MCLLLFLFKYHASFPSLFRSILLVISLLFPFRYQVRNYKNHFTNLLFYVLICFVVRMVELIDENLMLTLGLNFVGFKPSRTRNHSANTNKNHFERAFGASSKACCALFNDLQVVNLELVAAIKKPQVTHFLLALHWLKRYPTEEASAGLYGLDEDTIRKWIWKYCTAIQALKTRKVSFSSVFVCIQLIILTISKDCLERKHTSAKLG